MTETKGKTYEPLITLNEAIEMIADQPPIDFLFWGIPHAPCVALLVARAKAGKSIFMENMAYALVDDCVDRFLGMPIKTVDRVVVVSFEEPLHLRTQRQIKQIKALNLESPEKVLNKIWVFNKDEKQFLSDRTQQEEFLQLMVNNRPDVLFIDSLGRMGIGQIEDSRYAQELMLFLRVLCKELDCPVIVVHHIVKSKRNEEVELSSMAGSRVISQEGDAMISLFDGPDGVKILKPLAWRYHSDNDTEITFRINNDCIIEHVGTRNSDSYTRSQISESNFEQIYSYIEVNDVVSVTDLIEMFVDKGVMARSTLFENLKNEMFEKVGKGLYKTKSIENVGEKTTNKTDINLFFNKLNIGNNDIRF